MGADVSAESAREWLGSENSLVSVNLPHGRVASCAEAGVPSGWPVLYFPGLGGTRYVTFLYDKHAKEIGARVVGVDYPGIGQSTCVRARTLKSWVDDVVHIADALFGKGVRFSIMGTSAGGAHALACAASLQLKDRVAGLSLIGPWVSLRNPGVHWSKKMGIVAPKFLIGLMARCIPYSNQVVFKLAGQRALKHILSEEEIQTARELGPALEIITEASAKELLAHGSTGFAETFLLCCEKSGPFDIDFESITQPVTIFAATDDKMVKFSATQHLAKQLVNCEMNWVEVVDGTHDGLNVTQHQHALERAVGPMKYMKMEPTPGDSVVAKGASLSCTTALFRVLNKPK